MVSKKRNLEKVEAISKASKEGKPAHFEEVSKELIRLIGLAERGELPVRNRRDNNAPKSQARLDFDARIDRMADRIKHIPPAPKRMLTTNEDQTVDVESESLLSAEKFLGWIKNRFKV